MLSCSYLVKKMSIFSKARFSHVIFSNFHEKPMLSCPYLVRKVLILSKLHWIMDQKVNRLPFSDFYKKSLLSLPYFVKKTSILGKQTTVMPRFSQKTSNLKNRALSYHYFFPMRHAHIWWKTSILSKLQNIMGQKGL